ILASRFLTTPHVLKPPNRAIVDQPTEDSKAVNQSMGKYCVVFQGLDISPDSVEDNGQALACAALIKLEEIDMIEEEWLSTTDNMEEDNKSEEDDSTDTIIGTAFTLIYGHVYRAVYSKHKNNLQASMLLDIVLGLNVNNIASLNLITENKITRGDEETDRLGAK
ncbi:hypothetical protein ACJX0J_041272, partial [Zea mays]